ncbi:Alcohol dehydrogenase zinc-binding domain protein [Kribbella flavida DSM 17836]|uniref:Alcohol dehydrogenase zinc-binding domain protein n=1 Tax=Kribbella flavida (strain DSM 17836 / JCM 10339 / NBRC 14399) TaxID=479435 RepID=D2Q1P3_KRIFD|nr:NADP-dependent oxidoreductase [Kribbella flavida]ADB32032.1 Alcohol dehydrogenase zinc-binding domain protein [Kribbella flavida DSM 17836]
MTANEKTMRAVVARGAGGPEVLHLENVRRPSPGLTEILVRVQAAGVNPTDWKRRAKGGDATDADAPVILGYDVAGVVEEVGPGVTWLQVGDEVLGMPKFPVLPGAYAEYVAAPSRQFVRKPASLSVEQAAGLPLAALTAWQGLVETGGLRSGQRVLVHAAAGGVGHLAVQLAKSFGAEVIGTASAAKHDFVRSLGADEVIDYRTEDFAAVLRERPVDLVLDPIAGDTGRRSLDVLKDGGSYVCILSVDEATVQEGRRRGIRAEFTLVEPDRLGLTAITDLVAEGKLRVELDSVFPLAEAAAAHRRGETNQAAGKIVLRV